MTLITQLASAWIGQPELAALAQHAAADTSLAARPPPSSAPSAPSSRPAPPTARERRRA
ncbi:hypothetical protein [Nonomuraea sp. SYSU D8015]|uniref:hypothetical protein n=1 Tax=Nonomuraea sp. SYSU D8015 TaxID=2593644 RepID=UPI003FA5FFEA